MSYKKSIFILCTLAQVAHAEDLLPEYPAPLIGVTGGYQFAVDDSYNHRAPNSSVVGLYGGLQLSPSLSWDLGYQHHDNLDATKTQVTVSTWLMETTLRYDWYLQEQLSLYGRLGLAYWDMESTRLAFDELDETGISPLGEVGVHYRLTPNVGLSVGYQYIDEIGNEKENIGAYDSHSFLLGLFYTFGNRVFTSKEENSNPLILEEEFDSTEIRVAKPTSEAATFPETTVGYRYSFPFDSAEFPTHFSERLAEVAHVLNTYPQAEVEIIGHADSTGSVAYNQTLSEQRAQVVADKLLNMGVSSTQIKVGGKGESAPVASNATKSGRAQNRFVEVRTFSFEYQKQGL